MKTAEFNIRIKATKEKVWEALWNEQNYREWTSVFSEGSYAKTDNWKEGSKVLFLSPTGEGMYSTVTENKPNERMAFKHIGVVKNNEEQPLDEETKKWSGAMETYTLTGNGETNLSVTMDINADYEDYFKEKFPKALEKVKEIAER